MQNLQRHSLFSNSERHHTKHCYIGYATRVSELESRHAHSPGVSFLSEPSKRF